MLLRASGAVALVAVIGCGEGGPEALGPGPREHPHGPVIATVDGREIGAQDVRDRMQAKHIGAREALDELIGQQLLLDWARRRGLLSDSDLEQAFKAVQVQKLLAVEVEARATEHDVAEQDIRDRYRMGEAVTAAHLLVSFNERASRQTRQRARSLAETIREAALHVPDGRAFAALEEMQDTTGQGSERLTIKHEDLGEFGRESELLAEFVEQAMRLRSPGEVSPLFETRFGLHVIRLEGRRNRIGDSLDKARPEIVKSLLTRRREQQYTRLVESMATRASIVVDEAAFGRTAAP